MGWLSDIGLESLWDVPKDTGRYKEAVRHIIHARLELQSESGLSRVSAFGQTPDVHSSDATVP